MGPVEALKLAGEKEREAIKLYQKMIGEYPEIRETLELLVNEEHKHEKLINDLILKLTRY